MLSPIKAADRPTTLGSSIQPTPTREIELQPKPRGKPFGHAAIKPHGVQFVSWPGHASLASPKHHYFRPTITSPAEGKGDLPTMQKIFYSVFC